VGIANLRICASEGRSRSKRGPSQVEYSSRGRVVATVYPYGNRYVSVAVIKDRKVSLWRDYLDPLRVFAALEGRAFEANAAEAT
jgi:ketosteroid isomerase-like protein